MATTVNRPWLWIVDQMLTFVNFVVDNHNNTWYGMINHRTGAAHRQPTPGG